jgi:hypothetical protein
MAANFAKLPERGFEVAAVPMLGAALLEPGSISDR